MTPLLKKSDFIGKLKYLWLKIPAEQRKRLSSGSTGVVIRNTRRIVGTSRAVPNYGLLSVVIPVYNVETYLEECVLSVISQTYSRLQILLVDDGSTDGSLRIARRLARADRRVRVITKKNNGLGAARNTGILASTGKYIAFVDSDDIVPKDAYEVMLATLHRTGSDFVVGSINRLREKKRSVPKWAQEVHGDDRLNITLNDFPEILHNVFAWNKIFKKEFWDQKLGSFPEGVLYEDQEVTARAYVEAKSFDVLEKIVYDWRIRSDRSSITQQKDNVIDLADRLLVARRVNEFLMNNSDFTTYKFWITKLLGTDLALYYVQVPRVGDQYWNILRKFAVEITATTAMDVLEDINLHERLLLDSLLRNSRLDFESIIFYNAENGRSFPIDVNEGGFRAYPGYLDQIECSPNSELLLVNLASLESRGEICKVSLVGDNCLEVKGHTYIIGIDTLETKVQRVFRLVNKVTSESIELHHEDDHDSLIDMSANDAWTSYTETAFRVLIDPSGLGLNADGWTSGTEWYLSVTFYLGGVEVSKRISTRRRSGAADSFPLLSVDSGSGRWICGFSNKWGFTLARENYQFRVENPLVVDRVIEFDVVGLDVDGANVVARCEKMGITGTTESVATSEGRKRFKVILPSLPATANDFSIYVWNFAITDIHGTEHRLGWPSLDDRHAETTNVFRNLNLRTNESGYVLLEERIFGVRAESWYVDESSETISVTIGFTENWLATDLPEMVFANGRSKIVSVGQEWMDVGVKARYVFSLKEYRWNTYSASVESGMYSLRCVVADSRGRMRDHWTEVALGMQGKLPDCHSTKSVNVTFGKTPKSSALTLRIGPPLHLSERGKLMQARLQRSIDKWLNEPIYSQAVLFESFGGKTIGDSSLALFKEMVRRGDPRPKYWSVFDHSVVVPEGAVPLIMYSAAWYRILHTAEYLVNNNNFPFFYRKHGNQTYVQVWHGTPLKKIGNDIPNTTLSLPYIRLMQKEAKYWDYLLAQNEFAVETLPKAFGYKGTVLYLGYPRNDALAESPPVERICELRSNLGISDGKKVFLYAPTWRDNVRTENDNYGFISFLELKVAMEEFGDDCIFLIRGHHNVAQQRFAQSHDNVIDVTSYPNINDLIIASDCLITDYSSVMFDYVVTGKPVYFLVPDLEEYRDSIRGFYFAFDESLPGPIAMDTRHLAAEVQRQEIDRTPTASYTKFRSTYASLDDGYSSSRVYEAIWGTV